MNDKLLEANGLTEQDFEPTPVSDKERIDALENVILEMLLGGDEDE